MKASALPSVVKGHEINLRCITLHHDAKHTPKTITLLLSYRLWVKSNAQTKQLFWNSLEPHGLVRPPAHWQCDYCHLVTPCGNATPRVCCSRRLLGNSSIPGASTPSEHVNQLQKNRSPTTVIQQPRDRVRALPSNAFWALSASSWFLSGCTNIDNCKRKDLAIKIIVKDEEYFRDFFVRGEK